MTRCRLFLAAWLLWFQAGALAEPLSVLSSIKPLQLLVSAVGGEQVNSQLLLPPTFSPHDARLKPSQWQSLHQADLIVWVGPQMESFLASALSDRDKVLTLGSLAPEAVADDPH